RMPTFPKRDVVVQMKMSSPGPEVSLTYHYSAADRKTRLRNHANPFELIYDQKAKIALYLFPGTPPTYMTMAYPWDEDLYRDYRRTAKKERIAGYECTVWEAPAKTLP